MQNSLTTFWNTWKVFIVGLFTSVALALQELSKSSQDQSTRVFIFAAIIATLSYVAKQWSGQTMTIFGIIGTGAGVAAAQLTSVGHINWFEFSAAVLLAIYAAVTPGPVTIQQQQATLKAVQYANELQQASATPTPIEVNNVKTV